MLVLRGGPASTPFRLEKVLTQVKVHLPGVTALWADHLHFVAIRRPLSEAETARVQALLLYGPVPVAREREGLPMLVTPRAGTVSPWSSKATEIAHRCGLDGVERIERGVQWTLGGVRQLTVEQRRGVVPLLLDRMTEEVLPTIHDVERLFRVEDPSPMRRIPVLRGGEVALAEADRRLGLALSEDEIAWLAEVFEQLGRDPTDAELMMFAQVNSEHCRHKIFNAAFVIEGEPQQNTLFQMIRNTSAVAGDAWTHGDAPGRLLSAYSDNSAVIHGYEGRRFQPDPATGVYGYGPTRPLHVLMKVETHNHPTAVSPFQGAATGTGGEIRDEGATGRGGKPKAGMCGFSVSHLRLPDALQPWEDDPPGRPSRIASPLQIMLEGPIGAASFANEFGRPNLAGYFRTFEARTGPNTWRGFHKPIMIAGGVGNIAPEHVDKRPIPDGAALVLIGGPAMRIGLGGGAASSMASGTSSAELDFGSVQRANAEMERRCQEVLDACQALGEGNPILSVHDVGAGGLSNAFPELVHGGGVGGRFDLRAIHSAERGMSPLEIWCNEAQERYVLAVCQEDLPALEAICARERCPHSVVGQATAEPHLRVDDPHFGEPPVDLPTEVVLGRPPKLVREGRLRREPEVPPADPVEEIDLLEAALRVLAFPAVGDKTFLITIGDRSIGGMVARDQMVGRWQVPVADVAVTTATFAELTGEAMAIGERSPVAALNAPASARMAVGEAVTNLAAARIERLDQVVLSLNWMAAAGGHGDDADLYEAVRTVGHDLCPALGIAVPVGKDSLSMRTRWREDDATREVAAPLSLVATAFAPVLDATRTLTPELELTGDTELLLIDLGAGRDRMGASTLAQVYGSLSLSLATEPPHLDPPPDLDQPLDVASLFAAVQALNQAGLLLAYHDRSDGGLFATLCEMAFCSRVALEIDLPGPDPLRSLFTEELGAVLQIRSADVLEVARILDEHELSPLTHRIGRPVEGQILRFRHDGVVVLKAPRAVLHCAWSETTLRMQALRDDPDCARQEYDRIVDNRDPGLRATLTFDPGQEPSPARAVGRPPVAILREQGVNGQLEMAAAFDRAGFTATDVHMTDLVAGRVDLSGFVGMVACGGFSYGDVLGAGGGWASAIRHDERLRDQFAAFFDRSDSFALGVCNGCQMFSALGDLVPGTEDWPRFVRNRSEQFEARLCSVRIEPSPSVLLTGMAGSELLVPVAHGEGRALFGSEEAHDRLVVRGLVAARYVDGHGEIAEAEAYPTNPNGSPSGITALTTPSGRVTVLMPHPERAFRWATLSWCPPSWKIPSGDSPWMRMFRNARAWVG
jgi:phosphoribosylformylglycinamidine synthase